MRELYIGEVIYDRELNPEYYTGDLAVDMQIAQIKNGVTVRQTMIIVLIGWIISLVGGWIGWMGVIIATWAFMLYVKIYYIMIPKIQKAYRKDMEKEDQDLSYLFNDM